MRQLGMMMEEDPWNLWNTNTFLTALPKHIGIPEARERFSIFGDVSSMRPLVGGVSVSFYDVRSAWSAIQALGEKYCTPVRQQGERIVSLSSDVKLRDEEIAGVSNIREQEDGTVMVEFFDTRVAQRFKLQKASLFSKEQEEEEILELPPGLENYHRPTTKEIAEPAYVSAASVMKKVVPKHMVNHVATPLRSNENASSRTTSGHQIVKIKGLPKALLTDKCIEAMFQQAGLQDAIVSVSTTKSEPCGEALVTLRTLKDAESCMNHCQGRCWDPSGKMKVEAMLVQQQSGRCDKGVHEIETGQWKAPRLKTTSNKARSRIRSDTAESCTTVSTEAPDNDEIVS